MAARRILIVDDDPKLCEMVTLVLDDGDYEIESASTGADGLNLIEQRPPDLIILDVNLPDINGFDLLRELRPRSNVPVLMLTARADAQDLVTGLDTGADDYLTKPFRADELGARVRALLRRIPRANPLISVAGGEVVIDLKTRAVLVRGELIDLTPTEYDLLTLMAEHPGQVFEHHTLLTHVWGEEYAHDTSYLKVYIWHLRRKLEAEPRHPRIVLTEWGVGYRLAA
jgi:two-component system, OmpR family, KDP operon response regulator KdpE